MKSNCMQKVIYLLCMLLFFSQSGFSAIVQKDKARIVARNWLTSKFPDQIKAAVDPISMNDPCIITREHSPVIYIFSIIPKGFIIISADDNVFPVPGFSFESDFFENNQPEGFRKWMDMYADEIADARNRHLSADPEIAALWNNLSKNQSGNGSNDEPMTQVQPLITATWNQDFPYNSMCPVDQTVYPNYVHHVPAGCVAVAMGMIMDYWRYPNHGQGYHCITPPSQYGPQCANFGNTLYDWNGMIDAISEECVPASTLIYQAGVAVDMYYGPSVSTAFLDSIPFAFINYFKYKPGIHIELRTNYLLSDWMALLKQNIDNKLPVIYSGQGTDAHVFICDGYLDDNHFHFNWGWGGLYNGWYYLNNLNPGGFNYNYNQSAILDIKPDPAYYPGYCSGQTVSLTGDFGSVEDGSGPVNYYMHLDDCRWLISPDDSIQDIVLKFKRFAIGPGDMVKVYDGSTINDPLLATLSGTSLPDSVTANGSHMLIRLLSGFSTTLQGFRAEYYSIPVPYCSDSLYNQPSGIVSDGSGQHNYRNDKVCQYLILPYGAKTMTLTFTDFSTEQDEDLVTIYDLNSPTPIAVLSGIDSIPPAPVTSSTGRMMIQFSTNKSVRAAGWDAQFSITVGNEEKDPAHYVMIKPNPVTSFASVSLPGIIPGETGTFILYSPDGKVIYKTGFNSSPFVFFRAGIPDGLYIWRIVTASFTATGKIVMD